MLKITGLLPGLPQSQQKERCISLKQRKRMNYSTKFFHVDIKSGCKKNKYIRSLTSHKQPLKQAEVCTLQASSKSISLKKYHQEKKREILKINPSFTASYKKSYHKLLAINNSDIKQDDQTHNNHKIYKLVIEWSTVADKQNKWKQQQKIQQNTAEYKHSQFQLRFPQGTLKKLKKLKQNNPSHTQKSPTSPKQLVIHYYDHGKNPQTISPNKTIPIFRYKPIKI